MRWTSYFCNIFCTSFSLCMWHAGLACLDLFAILRFCLYGIRLKGESGVWTMEKRWVRNIGYCFESFQSFFLMFLCFHTAAPKWPLLHLGWWRDWQTERGRDRETESRAFTVKRKTGAHVQTGECCTAAYRVGILRNPRHSLNKASWFKRKPNSSKRGNADP